MSVESDLADTADATVRVPRNLMAHIRASYDTREKLLDWMLAIGVVSLMAWAFQDQIRGMFTPPDTVNDVLPDQPTPSQDIRTAFPFGGYVASDRMYNYNLPSSRNYKQRPAPSGVATPADPSANPEI